jgi:hypothetical protein
LHWRRHSEHNHGDPKRYCPDRGVPLAPAERYGAEARLEERDQQGEST